VHEPVAALDARAAHQDPSDRLLARRHAADGRARPRRKRRGAPALFRARAAVAACAARTRARRGAARVV
jgi:hypothetical protein